MPSRFSSFTRATWTVTATKWTTRNGVGGWRFIDAALSLTRRVLGATQRLQPALDEFNEMRAEKQTFITENGDDDGGEPECGWSKYGERITDYAYELADLGGGLADAITAVLGGTGESGQS